MSEILQICGKNLLTFAEISQKFRKKLQNIRENPEIFAKKIAKNMHWSGAELGIPKVQKNANLVDLEKCCKMRLWSLS